MRTSVLKPKTSIPRAITSGPPRRLDDVRRVHDGLPAPASGYVGFADVSLFPTASSPMQRTPAAAVTEAHIDIPPGTAAWRSAGQVMAPSERALFEARMQQDFSSVRVHTGPAAAEAAQAANARAYTTGRDIVFGRGEYRPGTAEGNRLLAHELTHVVQQSQGVSIIGGVGRIGDAHEQQADAVADAIMTGGSAAGLLPRGPSASIRAQPVLQRKEAGPASEVASAEEEKEPALPSEGDAMRQAVLASARRRVADKTTIMTEAEIAKVRETMANYTTCVEFAGQTFADAIRERSKALHRSSTETRAAGTLLSGAKRTLDAEYGLQAEIDAYRKSIKLIKAPLRDSTNRQGKETKGIETRLDIAQKEQTRLASELTKLEDAKRTLEGELTLLRDAKSAAAGDKEQEKDLKAKISAKQQEIRVKNNLIIGIKQLKDGQRQMIKALESVIRKLGREETKLEGKIAGRKAKLDMLDLSDDMLVRPTLPLMTRPKPGEYVLLGAGEAQGYGVKKETSVTLGKGAFKHIAVFVSSQAVPAATDKSHGNWELWQTLDGGGVQPVSKSIMVCLDDLRVAPGESKDPWFASKTTLIGWVDMDKLIAGSVPDTSARPTKP